jgi:PAS domain S-box-containing protein
MSVRQAALAMASAFAVLGITWVLTTDVVVYALTDDLRLGEKIHLAADWAFLLVTGAALFEFARRIGMRVTEMQGVLHAVIRSMGDGMIVFGHDRRIVYANPAALRLFACDSDELLGMTPTELTRRFLISYPNGALVKPEALVSQRAYDEPGPLRYKVVLRPGTEQELVVLASAAGVREDPDAKVSLVVGVIHDVTAEEHLEQLRDRFFSAAAHALKTPVAIIKANVQVMAQSATPIAGTSRAVQRQCDRIDLIVQNLLTVSRARTRSLELFPAPLELTPLVENTARELVDARAACEVETDIVGSPPIRGDRERLQLVVRNLAHEALTMARPKTPLKLRLVPHDRDIELSVHFDPLPTAEQVFAGAEEQDDTKLGRCATTTIVEAHGGSIGDDTVNDHEAVLWVRLPALARAA